MKWHCYLYLQQQKFSIGFKRKLDHSLTQIYNSRNLVLVSNYEEAARGISSTTVEIQYWFQTKQSEANESIYNSRNLVLNANIHGKKGKKNLQQQKFNIEFKQGWDQRQFLIYNSRNLILNANSSASAQLQQSTTVEI